MAWANWVSLAVAWALLAAGFVMGATSPDLRYLLPLGSGLLVLLVRGVVLHRHLGNHVDSEQYGPGRGTHDEPSRGEQWSWLGNPDSVEPSQKSDQDGSQDQAAVFVRSILVPWSVNSRIKEKIEPLTRAMQCETRITMCLPTAHEDRRYWVPVAVERKGTLHDSYAVKDSAGDFVHTLTFDQYADLVREVLHRLVASHGVEVEAKYLQFVEAPLMSLISRRAPASQATAEEASKVIGRLASLLSDWGPSRSGVVAVSLAKKLVYEYAIVAEVSVPKSENNAPHIHTVTTTVRRILPFNTPRPKGAGVHHLARLMMHILARGLQWVRSLAGVRPSRFLVSAANMVRSQSYHLEFMGPVGTYLGKQSLVGYERGSSTYARLRGRHGQRYAHLYVRRGAAHSRPRHVHLDLAFFERPPGSLGSAAIAAFSCALLIWMGARVTRGDRGDVVALMMAFPALAASWIGLDRPQGPFGGSLTARASSILTLALAVAAAARYLQTWDAVSLSQWSLFGTSGAWALLLALACMNVIGVVYALVRRSALYHAALSRPVNNGEPDEEVAT